MKQIHFTHKPKVVSIGETTKGFRMAFITFGIEEADGEWTGWQERIGYEPTINPAQMLTSEIMLKATDEELMTLAKAYESADNEDWWREIREAQIRAYDNSDAVNRFLIDDMPMWLDKATRVGLVNSISIEQSAGRIQTTLWHLSHRFSLPTDAALGILSAIELYAIDCYSLTASRIASLQTMTLAELQSYDFRNGYPPCPTFYSTTQSEE